MTPKELKRAKELCEKATPGPWFIHQNDLDGDYGSCTYQLSISPYADDTADEFIFSGYFNIEDGGYGEDFDFIAESRDLLPKAIAEIEQLQKANGILRGIREIADDT